MDCSFFRDHLFEYHENMLEPGIKENYEKHLVMCPECAVVHNGFQSVEVFISQVKAHRPDPFTITRTMQIIDSEFETSKIKRTYYSLILKPIALALLLFVALLIGFSIGKQGTSKITDKTSHEEQIRMMRSDMQMADFMDEDKTF